MLALHNLRILHLDLKPSNAMVVKGKLKLIDFGGSKKLDNSLDSVILSSPLGSKGFMAPEYFIPVTDTSLNSDKILYRFSTKTDVFAAGNVLEMMINRCQGARSDFIEDMKIAVSKCTQNHPQDRPSVRDLKRAIE